MRELKVERASISSAGSRRFSRERREPGCQLARLRPRNATVVPWGSRVVVAAIAANPFAARAGGLLGRALLPANVIVDEAIRSTFATETTNRIEFYSEFLDVTRFPGEAQQERERGFFAR